MRVLAVTRARFVSGSDYRALRVLSMYPRRPTLLIPRDLKLSIMGKLDKLFGPWSGRVRALLDDSIEIKDSPEGGSLLDQLRYVKYLARIVREVGKGHDIAYFTHSRLTYSMGLMLSGMPWTSMLQVTPGVGSVVVDEGQGVRLLLRNLRLRGSVGVDRLLEKYAQLQLFKRIHGGTLTLAVSRSVVYELMRLGINIPMLVVDPGNGVDPCVSGGDRDIDVVFYSRITQEKGALDFMRIVRALSRLRRLRVVMMGWGGGALVDLLKKMNPGNVEFRLNVDRDEAMRTLAASKVMIYPTMLDAFPLVILEALSCGTPVIAHDIPAVRFNFNTRAVVKVRPLDYRSFIEATLKLLDSDLRELSTEAYNFARRFTWDEVVRSEWNALGKVLEYWERFPHQPLPCHS